MDQQATPATQLIQFNIELISKENLHETHYRAPHYRNLSSICLFVSDSATHILLYSRPDAGQANKYQYVLSIVPYQFPIQYIPFPVPIEGTFTARFNNAPLSPAVTFFPVVSVSLSFGVQGLSIITPPLVVVNSTPVTLTQGTFAVVPNGAFSPLFASTPPVGSGYFFAQCGIAVFGSISNTNLVPILGASSSKTDGHSVWMIGGLP